MEYDYVIYARKSSERDELQALSIDSQIKEMVELAEKDNLNVIEVKKESHSAKDSGERPVFNEMIRELKADKYQGIITWATDRLSRNAGDLGVLVDIMDQKHLCEVRTYNQKFTNSPNDKFLLMILGSQAKLENDNKAINVKRGLKTKCQMGFRPGMPPLGYLNDRNHDKGSKKIMIDPEKAPIITEMFEKIAYQEYSGRDIFHWLKETGFRTRTGKIVALSTIYDMLKNPYYYGEFEYPKNSGDWYKVNHDSIISKELFDEVQNSIAVAPRTRPGMKEFEFTRLMKCGACGAGISAEEKFKKLSDKSTKRYIYYHCSRGVDRNCKEGSINEEELIEQLLKILGDIPINTLKAQTKLRLELERYNKFAHNVLSEDQKEVSIPKIDLRNFAKYILREGSREEKRDLLSCLNATIYLKNRGIYLK